MAANGTGYRSIARKPLIEKYIERYVEGNMDAEVRIERGVRPATTTVYSGRARVHPLNGSVQMGFGDEPQYMVSGSVSIPVLDDSTGLPTDPRVNDTIVILRHGDPGVAGRSLRVMHVDSGGQYNTVVSMTVMGAEASPTASAAAGEPF